MLVSNSETEVSMSDEKTARICALNDQFRSTFIGGRVVFTQGLVALPEADRDAIVKIIQRFDDFSEHENDPYSEHDFGSFDYKGDTIFFKIDYYDTDLKYGSPDPADPTVTTRVMTVMLAEEY